MKNYILFCLMLIAFVAAPGCRTKAPGNPGSGQVPTGQFVHALKYGESLEEIANRYGRDPEDIIAANHMKPPYSVYDGYQLLIPPIRQTAPSFMRPRPVGPIRTPPVRSSRPSRPRKDVVSPSVSEDIIAIDKFSIPEAPPLENSIPISDGAMASTSRSGFIWPAQGQIALTFHDSGGQIYHGIAILAPAGAQARAAKAGTVIATGELIKGYGKMVIVKHSAGLVSIYGNLKDILVKSDQSIKVGDVVGTVGQDIPNPSQPHLHFQVRLRNKAVDPMNYLPDPS